MSIHQIDIKLLWGKAASRCAFPGCRSQLIQDSEATSSSFPIGEQAHIVAKEKDGPRGKSPFTPAERDSYANLILLCPTHHTMIDKTPEDYPVEKLQAFKTNHELWVEQTLAWDLNQKAKDIIYTSLIDSAIEYCHLPEWNQWTERALDSEIPIWPVELPDDFLKFRQKVFSTDFPGTLIELEKAAKTLSILLNKAARVFQKHSKIHWYDDGTRVWEGVKFYKISVWNTERYDKLAKEWDDWIEECHQLIIAATKAANWFREVVRRDISPMFFAAEGKFTLTYPCSENMGLLHPYLLPEYTQEEKANLPDSLSEDE